MKMCVFKLLVFVLAFSGLKLKSIVPQQPLTVSLSSSAMLDDTNFDDVDEADGSDGSADDLTVARPASVPAMSSTQLAVPMTMQVVPSWQQVISDLKKQIKALNNATVNNAALEKTRFEFMQDLQALLSQRPKPLSSDNASSFSQLTADSVNAFALLPPPTQSSSSRTISAN